MAIKKMSELKQTIMGIRTFYAKKDGYGLANSVPSLGTPDYKLPVQVDEFSYSQDDATINRVKVHGMNADWCTTSTAGDITITMTIPSVHKELIEFFFGKTASVSAEAIDDAEGAAKYAGFAFDPNAEPVYLGLAMEAEDTNTMFVINKAKFYASIVWDTPSTTPIAIKLTGNIESKDNESTDLAILTKQIGG